MAKNKREERRNEPAVQVLLYHFINCKSSHHDKQRATDAELSSTPVACVKSVAIVIYRHIQTPLSANAHIATDKLKHIFSFSANRNGLHAA